MSDDGTRDELRRWLDGQSAGPGFTDRAIAHAVSSPRRRFAMRRVAAIGSGLAAGAALAAVLGIALANHGPYRLPAAVHHVAGSPLATTAASPSTLPTASAKPATAGPTRAAATAATLRPTPTPPPPPTLGERDNPAMAYDPASRTVLLYGGMRSNGATYLNDTWRWDGTRWTQVTAVPAGMLYSEAMAYDAASDQLLMVGATVDGYGVTKQGGDAATYAWTGSAWQQLRPSSEPVNFQAASMVFDTQSRRLMLLTSGVDRTGSYTAANRLYAWDGARWSLLWTSPPGTVTSYEPHLLVALPGGGYAGLGENTHEQNNGQRGGAVYTFTGSAWTENDVPVTPGMVAAAVFDPAQQRVVALGGSLVPVPDAGPGVDATFLYDGAGWTSSPLPQELVNRVGEGLAFDSATGEVVLAGGIIGQGFVATPPPPPPTDTWGWNGSAWARRAE